MIPLCRRCHEELLPLHTTLHRWWCINQQCSFYHDQQHIRLPQGEHMAKVYSQLAARIAHHKLTP